MPLSNIKLKRLAEKYREGIAEVLGVPPEAIREDVVERWVENWVKALTRPEFWNQLFGASDHPAKEAGKEMGYILKDLGRKYPDIFAPKLVVEYAKKVSDVTGIDYKSILRSQAAINYWKKVVEE